MFHNMPFLRLLIILYTIEILFCLLLLQLYYIITDTSFSSVLKSTWFTADYLIVSYLYNIDLLQYDNGYKHILS